MKMKVAKYISEFMVKKGVEHVFTITGGGAMHLMMPLGIRRDCNAFTIIMNRRVPSLRKGMPDIQEESLRFV